MRREETAGGIEVIGGEARRVPRGRVDHTLRLKASISSQLRKAPFVCDRDELRSQSLNAFRNLSGAEAAEVFQNADGRNNARNAKVHIATYQTLDNEHGQGGRNFFFKHYPNLNCFSRIVIDEHTLAQGIDPDSTQADVPRLRLHGRHLADRRRLQDQAQGGEEGRKPACSPNHRPWSKVCKSASTPPDAGSRPPSMAAMPASRWRNATSASPSVSLPKRRSSPTSATSESIRPSVMTWPIVRSICSGGRSPESRIVRSPRVLAGRVERASACWRSNCAPAANPGSRRIWA